MSNKIDDQEKVDPDIFLDLLLDEAEVSAEDESWADLRAHELIDELKYRIQKALSEDTSDELRRLYEKSIDENAFRRHRVRLAKLRKQYRKAVSEYLGTFGDAIESRIKRCLEDAERLCALQFYSSALTMAVTSIELIIRFLLIRPLVSGAFLSPELEDLLAEKIGSGRSDDDRKLLPKLLLKWGGIDATRIALPEGELLWSSLTNPTSGLLAKRNRIVHQGEEASQSEGIRAIRCARIILNDIVYQLASKFGFTLETTGRWSVIRRTVSGRLTEQWFSELDPISQRLPKST